MRQLLKLLWSPDEPGTFCGANPKNTEDLAEYTVHRHTPQRWSFWFGKELLGYNTSKAKAKQSCQEHFEARQVEETSTDWYNG